MTTRLRILQLGLTALTLAPLTPALAQEAPLRVEWQPIGPGPGVVVYSVGLDILNRNRIAYGADNRFVIASIDLDDPNSDPARPHFVLAGPDTLIAGTEPTMSGDAATSIVVDPFLPGHLFVGFAKSDRFEADPRPSGVAESYFRPSLTFGSLNPIPSGSSGGVDLTLDQTPIDDLLFAAVYQTGVFRRPAYEPNTPWQSVLPGATVAWIPQPTNWRVYRIRNAPGFSGRVFAGFGDPETNVPDANAGVWVTNTFAPPNGTSGNTWRKITVSPATDTPGCEGTVASMGSEAVNALLPVGSMYTQPAVLFLATNGTLRPGKGGLYRGVCTSGACDTPNAWSWCKVLNQRNVTGVVASPESSKVFYATVSNVAGATTQPGQPGLWASRDGGVTWGHVAEAPLAGLPNLSRVKLFAWPADTNPGVTDEPRTLYAGTAGAGLFQGSVTCAAPGPGNPDSDGDGVSDYCDNCPSTPNPAQNDNDQNGIGNMCQPIAAPLMNGIAAEDGRIAESGENTSVGGAFAATLTNKEAILIGDSSTDKQWRSIISFDTSSLPDNAIPVSARLTLRRAKRMGNPYATLGRAVVDMKAPIGNPGLEASDFQQSSGVLLDVATLSQALTDEAFSTAMLNAAGLAAISKTAPHTQFRIRFLVDDDNDNVADFIGYYSAENVPPGVDQVPRLQITYVTP